jgi:phosphoribosylanthranilate isomerase
MFQVKICGITTAADAILASEAGADAIGLNFYEQSPRSVTPERAGAIVAALPAATRAVGVFVNAPLERILALCAQVPLNAVQLHGDEPAAMVASLRIHLPQRTLLVRALRCREASLQPISDHLAACIALGPAPDAVLLDAYRAGEYGGTGAKLDWQFVARQRGLLGQIPLVLAGGLAPGNVAAAIAAAHPQAVDTASGVESSPGKKDPQRVRDFISVARAAFAGAGPHRP